MLARARRRRRRPRRRASRPLLDGLEPPARPRPPRRLALRRRDGRGRRASASTPRRARRRGTLERIVTGLPTGGNHWTRTVRVGPDGMLYVIDRLELQRLHRGGPAPRGDRCAIAPDGSGEEIYATRPAQLGRLRLAARHRRSLRDRQRPRPARRRLPALRARTASCRAASTAGRSPTATACPTPTSAPATRREIARVDPAGARLPRAQRAARHDLLRGDAAPPELRGAALVALHGSWNRTQKDGYKVVSLHWRADGAIAERDFLDRLPATTSDVIGRPVDVADGPDGAIYVSDDYAGAIYRVAATGAAVPRNRRAARRRPERGPGDPLAGAVAPTERAIASARGPRALRSERVLPLSRAGARRRRRGAGPARGSRGALRRRVARGVPRRAAAADAAASRSTDAQRRDLAVFLLDPQAR